MSDSPRKPLIPLSRNAKIAFAVVCLIGSIGGIYAALGFEMRLNLAVTAEQRWRDRNFHLVRVTSQHVSGARVDGNRLVAERWTRKEGETVGRWAIDARTRGFWTLDHEGGWLAWMNGGKLWFGTLDAGSEQPANLREQSLPPAPPLAMFAAGKGVGVVFADGTYREWSAPELEQVATSTLPVTASDQVITEGAGLAVWRTRQQTAEVFAYKSGGNWESTGVHKLPPGARPVLSAWGGLAAVNRASVVVDGVSYPAPGPLRSVAVTRFGAVLVTGEFEGIHRLHPTTRTERLEACAPRAALMMTGGRLASVGSGGVALYAVSGTELFTERGRTFIYAAGGLFALLVLYLLALFGQLAIKLILRGLDVVPVRFSRASTPLPPGLLEAFEANQVVLWAGQGLSTIAGHPDRTGYVDRLLQAAEREQWIAPEALHEIVRAKGKVDTEVILDSLIAEMESRRYRIVEYTVNAAQLPIPLCKAQYALYEMPFRAAVTTNHDNMLERLGADWNMRIYSTGSEALSAALQMGKFFLLKLYGDLREPPTILLTPAEVYAAAAENANFGAAMNAMLARHTVFFVGVDPDVLLRDLKAFDAPSSASICHWAVTTVSGRSWGRAAAELREKYGVEVIAFREDEADTHLTPWLASLARRCALMANRPERPTYIDSRV